VSSALVVQVEGADAVVVVAVVVAMVVQACRYHCGCGCGGWGGCGCGGHHKPSKSSKDEQNRDVAPRSKVRLLSVPVPQAHDDLWRDAMGGQKTGECMSGFMGCWASP
jgi:hypothetical protein